MFFFTIWKLIKIHKYSPVKFTIKTNKEIKNSGVLQIQVFVLDQFRASLRLQSLSHRKKTADHGASLH